MDSPGRYRYRDKFIKRNSGIKEIPDFKLTSYDPDSHNGLGHARVKSYD